MVDKSQFPALFASAQVVGREAGVKCRPLPMIVGQAKSIVGPGSNQIDYSKPVYHVDDGACGFAWVKVFPGNSPFANWLKKNGHARRAFGGGVDIWISEFGQSVERKEAMAAAMAKVLQGADIKAYAGSRLD